MATSRTTFDMILGRRRGFALSAALLMLTQCVCGSNNRPTETDAAVVRTEDAAKTPAPEETQPAPPVALKLPAAVDTKDLDDDERRILQAVLEDQYDPCGKQRSFLDSLGAADTCDEAKKLAALAVTKIAEGLSKKQVTQELLKEQARWASKQDFDFEGSPHFGEPGPGKKVVVEFFDYQCPHCKVAAKPAHDLVEKYGAVIYYKMLPLEIHPFAKHAALAGLAANRQGKFAELTAALFENQERLSLPPADESKTSPEAFYKDQVRTLAQKAGLDMAKFDADLADPAVMKLVERDLAESARAKITGTPAFFVNGYAIELDQLEAKLQEK